MIVKLNGEESFDKKKIVFKDFDVEVGTFLLHYFCMILRVENRKVSYTGVYIEEGKKFRTF